jgi:hypothetical protein
MVPSRFFVVVFSGAEASKIRPDAIMKALSEPHATSLARRFGGQGQGVIAFSCLGGLAASETRNTEILARFGDVLPDDPNFWALDYDVGKTSAHAPPGWADSHEAVIAVPLFKVARA